MRSCAPRDSNSCYLPVCCQPQPHVCALCCAQDSNEIGDAGASALFQRIIPKESAKILHGLKTLSLSNNALNDAALCVNLKPNWAKGYYRMGCALEECKSYKESASVFAKVVEMEPENAEASGRLMKARQMLEMVMNVERVNDPLWMHKPPPPKSEVQQRAEEAQEKSTAAVTAVWEEMGALPQGASEAEPVQILKNHIPTHVARMARHRMRLREIAHSQMAHAEPPHDVRL